MLKDYPIEYMLLGQHALGNEQGDYFCGRATEDEVILKRYVDQCMEAMNTGCFACFAHPDLIHFIGDGKVYKQHMRTMIREAKGCNVPLELNLAGLCTGRNYPNRLFWELVAEENAAAIIGCDAHSPAFLKDTDMDEKAKVWLEGLNIAFMESLQL